MRLELGSRHYDVGSRALVMGVADPAPGLDALLRQAGGHVADGADILEVGAARAEAGGNDELDPVVRAVAALRERFDVAICVGTSRASVARVAFAAGADVGRDVSGFADPGYLGAAAAAGASVVAVHAGPGTVAAVRDLLVDRAGRAEAAGIPPGRVVLDAGLDLGKPPQQALDLLGESAGLAALGHPLLLSVPGRTFLGDRAGAGLAAAALGVARGCRVVRSGDVRGARRVCDVIGAILEAHR